MKINHPNKNTAFVYLDNATTLYLSTCNKDNIIIHIQGAKGHPNALGEDASCEMLLFNDVIRLNSFPSNVKIDNQVVQRVD